MTEDQLQKAITHLIIDVPHIGLYYSMTDFDYRTDLEEDVPPFVIFNNKTVIINVAKTAKLKLYTDRLAKTTREERDTSGVSHTTIEGALLDAFDTALDNNNLNNEFASLAISLAEAPAIELINKFSTLPKKLIRQIDLNNLDLEGKSNEFKFDTAILAGKLITINDPAGIAAFKMLPSNYQVIVTKQVPTEILAQLLERTDIRVIAENLMKIIFNV